MQTIKNAIPNSFTLANLACGLLGIIWALEGKTEVAAYMIWLAAVFDFLDGFAARVLKATSEIGKQLDSLADMVTFGVLPAIIYYQLLQGQLPIHFVYLTFATALLSALRLAKFNIDEGQKTVFIGLPTPANALLVSAIPLILAGDSFLQPIFAEPWALLAICLTFSAMMVIPVTLFSLKFSNFKWQGNVQRWLFIILAIGLIIAFRISAIPLIIVSYILLSILTKNDKK